MDDRTDPYRVLGVAPDASPSTIRKAYHDRARAAHPDLVGDAGLTTMQRLNEAWGTLRDPIRRAKYDSSRMKAATNGSAAGAPAGRSGEPQWTGAAGPPPGRPSGSRLTFGLYAGWTLGEVARHDNGYLMWLADRREGRPFADEIRVILRGMKTPGTDDARKPGRWSR